MAFVRIPYYMMMDFSREKHFVTNWGGGLDYYYYYYYYYYYFTMFERYAQNSASVDEFVHSLIGTFHDPEY